MPDTAIECDGSVNAAVYVATACTYIADHNIRGLKFSSNLKIALNNQL